MLASPIIEGTIPAFYLDKSLDDGNGAALIAVPFTMSKAVHQNEVQKFSLKIKNLQESNYLLSLESNKIDFINNIAYFLIKRRILVEKKFITGMFYGVSKNKNGGNIPEIDKVEPWDNEEFSGKINYVLD